MENLLYKSPVVYDEIQHTYTLNGKPLSGITSMLSRQLFPNKLDGIPEHILEQARERGKKIHGEIEMWMNGFYPADPSNEFLAFMGLVDAGFIYPKYSEFIVSDGENFATPIDLIGSKLQLYDIKTTYEVDKEYCSWQLSICSYLLHKQQPEYVGEELAVIWLRDLKAEIIPVRCIPDSEIERLLDSEIKGLPFVPELPDIGISDDMIEGVKSAELVVAKIKQELDEWTAKYDELKAGLLKLMLENNVDKYEGEGVTLTVKKGYTKTTLDTKTIKSELPEVYKKYGKTTNVKPTLTININDNEKAL